MYGTRTILEKEQSAEREFMSIQIGDLFSLGDHRLLCGNAENEDHFQRLMQERQATMVFTDPPYNANYHRLGSHSRAIDAKENRKRFSAQIEGDDLCSRCFNQLLSNFLTNLMQYNQGAFYICMGNETMFQLMQLFKEKGGVISTLLIAVKNHFSIGWANYHMKHELILYGWNSQGKRHWCGSRKEHTILDFKVTPNKLHPTMKPVDLIQRTIRNSSQEGDIVLDCFAGSGSTLIAAHNEKRIGYAMELSPSYCQVILDRFQESTGIQPQKIVPLTNLKTQETDEKKIEIYPNLSKCSSLPFFQGLESSNNLGVQS